MSNIVLVALVERPDLIAECIDIINEEWPKSVQIRQKSLEKTTNADPPMSFALLDTDRNEVIGYARFLKVLNYKGNAALFETVVVRRSLRGKGYGMIMMNKLKEEALKRDYNLLLLCTHDKEKFYEKCGYNRCQCPNLITQTFPNIDSFLQTMTFDRVTPIVDSVPKKEVPSNFNAIPPPPMLPKQTAQQQTYMFCYT